MPKLSSRRKSFHRAVRDVPKAIGEYYAAGVFPAWAIYARQVRGLTLHNVRFETAAADPAARRRLRPRQRRGRERHECARRPEGGIRLRFIESQDVLLNATKLLKPAPVFLQVEGATNENIALDGGDIAKAVAPLAFKNGADEKSVKLRG
jgi:hypothetical protein